MRPPCVVLYTPFRLLAVFRPLLLFPRLSVFPQFGVSVLILPQYKVLENQATEST